MTLLLASLLMLLPVTVHAEYLGNLSVNEFDPNSTVNPYGAGSPYSPNSVTNEFGIYGIPYSNQSATNPYATDSPDSLNNPYGAGNPYRSDSPNNRYGPGWRIEGR